MNKYAVITFDEPEFEPSYIGTPNEGKGGFSKLFFLGKFPFFDLSIKVYKNRNLIKGTLYFFAQVYYALKSLFFRSESIFEFLDRLKIRGTFFGVFCLLDGAEKEKYIDIFHDILNKNHELGLHGYTHGPLTKEHLERSLMLCQMYFSMRPVSYSSPWGDDRKESVILLRDSGFTGFRVWNNKFVGNSEGIACYKYENSLAASLNNTTAPVILNIHGPDFYPRGKKRIERDILELVSMGYKFLTFSELCKLKYNEVLS